MSKVKKGVGRPSKFKPELIEQAHKLALLGATNDQMAEFFGISGSTFDKWLKENAEFSGAVKSGKLVADATVANSLYHRANGFSHPAVKIFNDRETGVTEVPYIERYPPDATSAIFWLKNRQPHLWRDKADVDHNHKLEVTETTPLELARGLAFVLEAARRAQQAITAQPEPPPPATARAIAHQQSE